MTPSSDPSAGRADYEELFRAVHADVVRFCARRVGADAAEDVAAAALLTAWRRFREAPVGLDARRAWVFGIARKQLLNEHRSVHRRAALAVRIGAPVHAGDPTDLRVDLSRAWERLTDDQREVIALTAWDGLDSAAAGAVLGISSLAYRLRLTRARSALRAHLDLTRTLTPTLTSTRSR